MALLSQTRLPQLFRRTPKRHQSLQKCYIFKRNSTNIFLDKYLTHSHLEKNLMEPVPAPSNDGGMSSGKMYENGSWNAQLFPLM